MRGPTAPGSPVAILTIPSIGVRDLIVVQGTSPQNLTLGPGHKALHACVDAINALYEKIHGKLKADANEVRDSSLTAQRLMVAVPAVGIPVAVVLALLLTRSITRPVARGVEASEAIAKGDLTRRLNLAQHDEVGLLTQATASTWRG